MNSSGAPKKVTHHMNGAQSSTSGSSSEDHILSLKSEFAEKEGQYQAKIAQLESELTNTQMTLNEVKVEKEHYYTQLSNLDQFLAEAQQSQDAAQNEVLAQYLAKIQ